MNSHRIRKNKSNLCSQRCGYSHQSEKQGQNPAEAWTREASLPQGNSHEAGGLAAEMEAAADSHSRLPKSLGKSQGLTGCIAWWSALYCPGICLRCGSSLLIQSLPRLAGLSLFSTTPHHPPKIKHPGKVICSKDADLVLCRNLKDGPSIGSRALQLSDNLPSRASATSSHRGSE